MTCPNCGKEILEGIKFCDGCGAHLEGLQQPVVEQPMAEPPKQGKGMLILVIIMAIIILAGIGFGIWYFALRGDDKGGNNTTNNTVENNTNTNTNTNGNTIDDNGDKLVCRGKEPSDDGTDVEVEIVAVYVNGKASKISQTMTFATAEQASQYGAILQLAESFMEDGVSLGVTVSGNKVTIANMLEAVSQNEDEFNFAEASKEELKQYAEEQNYTCS